jgi:hypothetical protein
VVHKRLETEGNWFHRKKACLQKVYTSLNTLIEDSKAPKNISLAVFKPAAIIGFEVEEDEREWKNEWKEIRKQGDLFATDKAPEILIPKLPYKFYYRLKDENRKISRMMIDDWEIGALYWNCFHAANKNEQLALEKVRHKYEKEFLAEKEIYLFLGTTKEWHQRRANNPFVIIGVFYPKREIQGSLF